jgi:hypothetical protein
MGSLAGSQSIERSKLNDELAVGREAGIDREQAIDVS